MTACSALAPHGRAQLVARQRAEVAQQLHDRAAAANRASAPTQGVPDQLAAADAALLGALPSTASRRRRRGPRRCCASGAGRRRSPRRASASWPSGSAPAPMQNRPTPSVRPSDEVLRADAGRCRERRRRLVAHGEVGDDEGRPCPASRAGTGSATWRSARWAAFGSMSPSRWLVRGQAGVRERVAGAERRRRRARRRGRAALVLVARGRRAVRGGPGRVAHDFYGLLVRARDPDGDAPISAPRPKIQTNRPSGTGPRLPSVEAAGVWLRGVDRVEVGDDVLLVLGVDVGVVEDRHRLRAGQHGLVDVLAR